MKWLADYFNLTKGEKRGFTILIGVIVILMGLPYVFPFFVYENEKQTLGNFNEAMIRYETGVAAMDTAMPEKSPEQSKDIEYFAFDPNKLDVDGWLKLGLDEKTAHIIDNYREAGGEFREKADLKEIYGLEDSTYQRLKDYIELPEHKNEASTPVAKSGQNKEEQQGKREDEQSGDASENHERKSLIDLNKADTTALKKVYGIGSVYGKRVVKYRRLLGGFWEKEQLMEVYGIDSAQYENIAPQVEVIEGQVEKISLNEAEFQTLHDHPYLEYSDVLAIVNYRDKVDSVKSAKELLEQKIIGQDLFNKIAPYIKP